LPKKGDVEDDSNVPDRVQDIKPRFHRARTQGLGASTHSENDELANIIGSAAPQSGDDSDDEEGADDESSTEWNLSRDFN
jgi:transportin-1